MNLQPLHLLPARDRVASAIRKAILAGELRQDEQITLEAIAGLLGVSRTPVREAFLILENEGLIRIMPNKRVVVLGMTEKNLREHYQIRAALESEAAALCCREGAQLGEIRAVLEQSKAVIGREDYEEYGNLNQAFHLAVWTAAGNERLQSMLAVMWNGLSLHAMETMESYARKSLKEHEQVVQALLAHDEESARRLMRGHILRSMEDMLSNLFEEQAE